jgi:hypothetical protein
LDRVPFLTLNAFKNGTASLQPAWTTNHHNFWLLPNFGSNIDHDDGSSYYADNYNFIVGGGGWTKHSGVMQSAVGNIQLLMSDDKSTGGKCASVKATDTYVNNTCITTTTTVESVDHCPPLKVNGAVIAGNRYFVPNGTATISCGGKTLSLAEAAAKGVDVGATTEPLEKLTSDEVLGLAKELLGF